MQHCNGNFTSGIAFHSLSTTQEASFSPPPPPPSACSTVAGGEAWVTIEVEEVNKLIVATTMSSHMKSGV